jgi:hypothetical protein
LGSQRPFWSHLGRSWQKGRRGCGSPEGWWVWRRRLRFPEPASETELATLIRESSAYHEGFKPQVSKTKKYIGVFYDQKVAGQGDARPNARPPYLRNAHMEKHICAAIKAAPVAADPEEQECYRQRVALGPGRALALPALGQGVRLGGPRAGAGG